MPNQHPALLEAMEQQSISLAKSGVTCSVKAQTAILAAANPVGGHYNKAKTVSENLKLHPALLSRFDLVFILIDKPDEEADCRLSDHIMNLHRKSSASFTTSSNNGSLQGTVELIIMHPTYFIALYSSDSPSFSVKQLFLTKSL